MTNIEVLIDRQIKKWELEKKAREEQAAPKSKEVLPIITVSRERGSSGSFLARRLAEEFDFQLAHRQVIDIICSNSGFRRRVVEALDEKTKSQIESWVEGLMHDHYVDSSDYFKHLHHTIIALARHGGLVVIGRGANFVLTLQTGFHIRVVAPERRRVERIMEFANVDKKAAQEAVAKSDEERAEFIKNGFGYDINDPHYYDLVINTGFIDIEDAVKIAIKAIGAKFEKLRRE
ncbi:MAG: cytidylate kinase-like family protein [candidate division Zixibacteria bacterium]|nr:cytidylate kinase-like family protein [candidate division Zixibacteria bacterium]MBU1471793.1 cytidylate kinase-like family protein [candidate division Zixibacteria bacterium]